MNGGLPEGKISVNGIITSVAEARVSAMDHGVIFGDKSTRHGSGIKRNVGNVYESFKLRRTTGKEHSSARDYDWAFGVR